jgi:alpha-L-fucosidase
MMKTILLLFLLLVSESDGLFSRIHRGRGNSPSPSGKYRISPKTGVRIAIPTPEQLQWQAQDVGALIHFNLATFIDVDGCSGQMVPDASLFKPYLLNTDNWVQTIVDFSAVYAVLVAKHACGFHMAPTNVTFPLSPSGQMIPYNYSVDYSPMKGVDVLGEFIKSCEKRQIKTGFYYTVATNNWFNVEGGHVSETSSNIRCIL